MTKLKVLIIDRMHESLLPLLQEIGLEADYQPQITPGRVKEIIPQYHGVIVRSKMEITEEIIKKTPNLKFIARAGSGIDNITFPLDKYPNVHVVNAPEGNRDAVAEHTVGLILTLFNKINTSHDQVKQKLWDREGNRGIEIKGKTIGIVGFGNMGSALANLLQSFQCQIIAYDKYKTDLGCNYVRPVSLDELFYETDILSLHVPLTSETNHLVDHQFINSFRKSIFLINTARGMIVPNRVLVDNLRSGKLSGAGLDVLEKEKLQLLDETEEKLFNELIGFPNVVITPHVAGWSHESYQRINEVLVEKIKQLTNL